MGACVRVGPHVQGGLRIAFEHVILKCLSQINPAAAHDRQVGQWVACPACTTVIPWKPWLPTGFSAAMRVARSTAVRNCLHGAVRCCRTCLDFAKHPGFVHSQPQTAPASPELLSPPLPPCRCRAPNPSTWRACTRTAAAAPRASRPASASPSTSSGWVSLGRCCSCPAGWVR